MNQARQTVLERLHKQNISAKDISGQFWCEKQMELFCTHKYSTPQMQVGMAMHAALQQEVFVPLAVEPYSYSDRLYKTAYENSATISKLLADRLSRELHVYGSIHGYTIGGQIDELRLGKDGMVTIVENKTTSSPELSPFTTKPHIVQVMLYRKMLEDLRTSSYGYDNFSVSYKLNTKVMTAEFVKGLKTLSIKEEYMSLESIFRKMFRDFQALPPVSDTLEIHYLDRKSKQLINTLSVKYNAGELESQLSYAFGYWTGQREAQPVPEEEKWKCRMCKFFGKECTTWWTNEPGKA